MSATSPTRRSRRSERPEAPGRIYQLGGPRIYTFSELMELMLREIRRRRALVSIPFALARFQAFFLERLPGRRC